MLLSLFWLGIRVELQMANDNLTIAAIICIIGGDWAEVEPINTTIFTSCTSSWRLPDIYISKSKSCSLGCTCTCLKHWDCPTSFKAKNTTNRSCYHTSSKGLLIYILMELPHKYCYGPHKCDSISRFSWIWQFYDKTSQPRKLACLQSLSLKAAPEAWCSLGMEISDLWNSNIVAHCTSSITTMYNTSQEVADTPELVVVHEADDVSHTRTWPRLEPLHTGIRRWKLQSPSLSSSWNPRMALNSSLFSYLQLLWAISFLNFLRQRQHKLWYPLHSLPLPLPEINIWSGVSEDIKWAFSPTDRHN